MVEDCYPMNSQFLRDSGGSLVLHGGTGGITAMCSCGEFLEIYKEDVTFRIKTPESIDPDRTNPNAPVVASVSDRVGSSSLAVARILLQSRDIIEAAILPPEVNKQAVIQELHACKECLVACEKAARAVSTSVDKIIDDVETNGIKRDSGGRALNPFPQVLDLDDNATAFLVNAKRAIRAICRLPSIVLSVPDKDNNFDALANTLAEAVGPEAPVTRFVRDNAERVRHFIELRNWQEHPGKKRTIIENFGVAPNGSIKVPMWHVSGESRQRIREDMLASQDFLVQVGEAMLIHLVLHAADKRIPFTIVEVKSPSPALPIRYRLSVDVT